MPLPLSFYERPVLAVARDCVGKVLLHQTADGLCGGRIVEAEAYRGPDDLAAHSSRGRTARTEAMFGPPARAYMFLLYGMHWAFNIVVGKVGEPHAILVRAVEPTVGTEVMARRRGLPVGHPGLANGPGKLCQALALDRTHYGMDLCGDRLFLEDGSRLGGLGRSARINVDYAGAWALKPWRFYERGNPHVSVRPRD